MAYGVEITARALAEARQARDWIALESPERAVTWYHGLLDRIETLTEHPRRCAVARESEEFSREIRQLLYGRRRATYRILFTVREETVFVLFIRHGARGPITSGDWLGDLG